MSSIPHPKNHGRLSLGGRIGTLLGVTVPIAGLLAAAAAAWGWGFLHWADVAMFLGMYAATVVGLTVGFHRLFVHRSFETSLPVKVVLTALGSMGVQGTMIHWVGLHRWHHRHSDAPEDVHSPHHQGRGVAGFLRGFWHAHIGWAFHADPPALDRYVRDLHRSPTLRAASALFPVWAALGLAIPAAGGALLTGTWVGAGTGLLWGGLVRILAVHHVTWSINSVCHLWGRRPYATGDGSRDNLVMGFLAFGEGWHNTHHAFPTSARHGLRWWQPDLSYWVIRNLSLVGLAWNVKLPSRQAQAAKRRSN
ncbi:acyl-CoA desaturase [Limnoglobus roseus]|uniref:Fatty acid desaturase n=1 Tax=Limnoglobus roseus TaxID=2598579 RepID=A0A5C1AN04_9BACT|nr:fatty acid desaturase [Limnoglobus roseus]QEL20611.1 fatty acid desaturase [Limnoglobus roseus]